MSDNMSDPDRIERDLDQTRSRLGTHLSELQDRLSPGQVIDDAMAYFRGSEGADFGRNLLDSVRANPLPAALTGIGLAWLMATGSRSSSPGGSVGYVGREQIAARPSRRVHVYRGPAGSVAEGGYGDDVAARVRAAELGVSRQTGEAEHDYSGRLDEARGKAMGLARQAQESAGSFGQRIRDALQSAKQTVAESAGSLRDSAGNLRDQASSAGSSAAASMGDVAHGTAQSVSGAAQSATDALARGGRKAGQAGGDLVSSLVESPVLLGALGLAAGAMLGILLPQSEREETALGDVAGQARDTASGLAQEAVNRGGNVAEAVLDAGRDSAEAHGLTGGKSPGELADAALSGDLAGNAKNVAQDVLRAGDEAARSELAGKKDQAGPKPR